MRHRSAADAWRVRRAGALGISGALALLRPAAIGETTEDGTDIEVAGESLFEPNAELDGKGRTPVAQRNPTHIATTQLRREGRRR
jgi:hypothetical protein